jgi:hypothetical protein
VRRTLFSVVAFCKFFTSTWPRVKATKTHAWNELSEQQRSELVCAFPSFPHKRTMNIIVLSSTSGFYVACQFGNLSADN